MTPGDAKKLLGGYAAGNLTADERRHLFEAALDDQELFEALAEEEKLRELLAGPVERQRLLRALEPAVRVAWFRRPLAWSLAGSLGAMLVITAALWRKAVPPPPQPPTVAMVKHAPPLAKPEVRPKEARREKPARLRPAQPGEPPPAVVARVERAPEETMAFSAAELRSGVTGGVPVSERTSLLSSADASRPVVAYRLQRRTDEGRWVEAPAGLTVRAGERVRVVVISGADGELQIRERDTEGVWRPLLPPGFRVRAGVPYTLPGEFTLGAPGSRRLQADFTSAGRSVSIPIVF